MLVMLLCIFLMSNIYFSGKWYLLCFYLLHARNFDTVNRAKF